uniref:NADP-dependent oxidoreductase domain-containing protein n=1 Tax=OCS116 cluster bacterium TaxID=2030921 RepID=A0A2A4YSX3_9PROT
MQLNDFSKTELGLGLIGIGRPWPTGTHSVCSQDAAHKLLQSAIDSGMRFFDTAAAYGASETVLGAFLQTLTPKTRKNIFVATKTGEHWPNPNNQPVDHSIQALEQSFENSQQILGSIDLLQLHKCTIVDLQNDKIINWFQTLKQSGTVKSIGVSVSSVDALQAAAQLKIFDTIQFPANLDKQNLLTAYLNCPTPPLAIINRPFSSGKITNKADAYKFLKQKFSQAIILSGTTNIEHLSNNISNFKG